MEFFEGAVVISKAGRDNGRRFIVLKRDGDYCFVADGATRKTEKPKRKKLRHLQGTLSVAEEIAQKIKEGETVTNSDIRKALAQISG